MFRYYQVGPTDKWEMIKDSDRALLDLAEQQVPMVSVLSVKDPITDEDDNKYSGSYKGDFYIDIDKKKISEAIRSAKTFNQKLIQQGVTSYSVFLSGKKGFHFLIPMENFCSGRPVKHLPLVYKEMAFDLYVDGIDMAVYNQGKPRLLRAANVKRLDNGKYKVSVSQTELLGLTEETYAELTSSARPSIPVATPKMSLKLETLFEACKSRVSKKLRAMKDVEYVPKEEVVKTLGPDQKLPKCIQLLIEHGDTKNGANFNQATMQFAAYMTNAGVTAWEDHAKTMAKNVKSSSYNTEGKRLQEIKKMYRYVGGSNNFGFSKGALFSVMEPCRDCAVCNGNIEDGEVVPEDYEEVSEIDDTPQGYFIGFGKQRKRLTTFTLDILSKFTESRDGDEYGEIRIGVNAMIKVNGHKREKVSISEDAWISTREFRQTFKGRTGYVFYGTDLDLQKLQHKLFHETGHIDEICYVHSVGMHRHKVGNRTVLVYAEPNFSVSSTKEKNTHEVWGSIPAPPCIAGVDYPEATDELKEFIDNMLLCNAPQVTATLVGWMALCHIKVQLTMRNNQFPILNLWGNSGSGKSSLASEFAGLHAVDYVLEHSPISLQGTTPWAAAQYCSSSESTPRLIEEFNAGEISNSKYDSFAGMFKAAWNMETFAKGGIERSSGPGPTQSGAKVMESKISAPLLVASEQAPTRPALRQRMIQVNITRSGREVTGREEAFYKVIDNRGMFSQLGKAMVWQSLTTHPDMVTEIMEGHKASIPRSIDARPRFSYQAILTGVTFFGKTLEAIGLSPEYVAEKVTFMRSAILNHLEDTLEDVAKEKLTTEVIMVLSEMSLQASAYKSIPPNQWSLVPERDYVKDAKYLYLDTKPAHSKYMRWSRQGGSRVILGSSEQFEVLLKQEDFFVDSSVHSSLGDGVRKIYKLDLEQLVARGVSVEMFEDDTL